MRLVESVILRTFGRPAGLLGRIGGFLMVRGKKQCGSWLIDRIDLAPNANVLEVGCGPGVLLRILSESVPGGHVVGVDPSPVMLEHSSRRCSDALRGKRLDLVQADAEALPFDSAVFDCVISLNSMQLWHEPERGARECLRVMRPSGLICIGFTPEAGCNGPAAKEILRRAGFIDIAVIQGVGAKWIFASRTPERR